MTDDTPRQRRGTLWLALALPIAAVVLALALQPWWLAPLVAQRLSASSGRAVHLETMWLSLSSSLEPVVQLRGIRIDNAPWADAHGPFAALAAATVVLSWRSLEERRPVIALLVLRGGEVDLERRSDGLRNWRLSHPDDRGPGRFKVLAIRGEEATLRFQHGPLELDLEVRATPNAEAGADAVAGEPMPTRLDARGTWRGVPFVLRATSAQALTLLETGRAFRLRGHAEAGAVRLDLDGHVGDIVRWPRVDAQIELAAPSLGRIATLLGARGGESDKALRVEGRLRGVDAGYALSALRAKLGASDLAGDLRFERGEQRDLLHAALTSESADLADLRSLAGSRPAASARKVAAAGAAPAAASAAASAVRAASAPPAAASVVASAVRAASAPADAHPKRPLDVELSFAARHLRAAELPSLQSARVQASIAGGRLQVPRFELGIARGRVAGNASVDLEATPVHGQAEVDASAVRIEALLGERALASRLSGVLRGRAVLQASGVSVDALVAGASGTLSAFVSGGTISSLLDAKIGLQGGKVVRSMLTGAEPIALRCAAAVVELRHGEGRIRTLVVDTERTRTTGTGSIDLVRRTLDVVLTPEAKQPGLFVLDRSIHLQGPLREPTHELVARARSPAAAARGCPEKP